MPIYSFYFTDDDLCDPIRQTLPDLASAKDVAARTIGAMMIDAGTSIAEDYPPQIFIRDFAGNMLSTIRVTVID